MHDFFMNRAIGLAEKGIGFTSPNPPVGSVLVYKNKIISEGYHKKAGSNHAEINALYKLKLIPNNSTLYVTLEPCFHHGKTPPCVNAIIESNISHVVIGLKDPNPKVNGKSINLLRKKGIKVTVYNNSSLIQQRIKNIMQPFLKSQNYELPYVTIKAGVSLDGKIATSNNISKWITNIKSRNDSRFIRSQHDAIVIGSRTVELDNPSLDCVTPYKRKKILKIVIDNHLNLNTDLNIFKSSNLLIAHSDVAKKSKIKDFLNKGFNIKSFGSSRVNITRLLKYLNKLNIQTLFVEGGGSIHGSFYDTFKINKKVIDKVLLYYSPILIGGYNSKSVILGEGYKDLNVQSLKDVTIKHIDDNFKLTGFFNRY